MGISHTRFGHQSRWVEEFMGDEFMGDEFMNDEFMGDEFMGDEPLYRYLQC